MGGLNSKEANDLNLGYYVIGTKSSLIQGSRLISEGFELIPNTAIITDLNTNNNNDNHNRLEFEVDDPTLLKLKEKYKNQLKPIGLDELTNFTNLAMCSRHLIYLSPNIALLRSSLLCIQMCCNQLTQLPLEIGYLNQLTVLDLSKNKLTSLPYTLGMLTKLVELKLNYNELTSLPTSIGMLKKLTILLVANNKLTELPREFGNLQNLVALDLSNNPITILPAEVGRLPLLRRLRLENCPLKTESEIELLQKLQATDNSEMNSKVMSLKELAARTVMQVQVDTELLELPKVIVNYLKSVQRCSFCQGPYFQTYFVRNRTIDKNELKVPLEYRLCTPHWNSEVERVSLLFCTSKELKLSYQQSKNMNLLESTVPYLTPPPFENLNLKRSLCSNNSNSRDGNHYFNFSPQQLKFLFKFKPSLRKSNSSQLFYTNSNNASNSQPRLSDAIDRTPRLPQLPNYLTVPRRSFNSTNRRSLSVYVP